ncbi:hypothetical protein GCM10010324_23770 [Streptomyces hiroshimensis]|uniref:Uncharacterized protein n=1 Tax=Streptomyces hiroshimensis TaxID=66424 RepID=A0ABQ2YAJ5_9ACTN|nr:hypothetical protein GCM10010324_23770 [Streptomyces hiroshimensis]
MPAAPTTAAATTPMAIFAPLCMCQPPPSPPGRRAPQAQASPRFNHPIKTSASALYGKGGAREGEMAGTGPSGQVMPRRTGSTQIHESNHIRFRHASIGIACPV